MALLDSGSTNNLRPGSLAEVETGIVIDVSLADGTSKFVQLPSGTLMCGDDTQVIVSLGQCVDILQCKAMWTKKGGFTLKTSQKGTFAYKYQERYTHYLRGVGSDIDSRN